MTITVDELIVFAKQLEGRTLHTLISRKPFTVQIIDGELHCTPLSTMKPRPHSRKTIKQVLERFNESQSLLPSEYKDVTWNASYTLTLLNEYVRER